MAIQRQTTNPFYAPLLVAGIAFAVTACAYGVMAVQEMDPGRATARSTANTWLVDFLDKHGATTMIAELVVLAIAASAAIGTDHLRARRTKSPGTNGSAEEPERR